MPRKSTHTAETVLRHLPLVRAVHWSVALSGLLLLFSGFGQFPLYKRYMVDRMPGFGWASDFGFQFDLHLGAAVVFSAAVIFHLVYHLLRRETGLWPRQGDLGESWQIVRASFGKGEDPPSGKYLAEQRVVYAFFGGIIILLIGTGLLKAAKNFPGISLAPWLTCEATVIHNLATVLFLLTLAAHVFALLLKSNRPLLAGMFTGRVRAGYARRRHALWETGAEGSSSGTIASDTLPDREPVPGEGSRAA